MSSRHGSIANRNLQETIRNGGCCNCVSFEGGVVNAFSVESRNVLKLQDRMFYTDDNAISFWLTTNSIIIRYSIVNFCWVFISNQVAI